MISIEEIHIEEVRGIKKLTLPLARKNFAVYGPNGSGKSGVVDATEFGLTGNISRLTGKGTGGISVKSHGPHVDSRGYPDAAFVRLKPYLTGLNKTVTLERKLAKPKAPIITPDTRAVRGYLADVASHTELTLSRREIIKYILTESSNRAKEVQALLRLDELGQIRAALKTATNKLGTELGAAQNEAQRAVDDLRRHLDLEKLDDRETLEVINQKRRVLNLRELRMLETDTSLTEGTATRKRSEQQQPFNKESALRDIVALHAAVAQDTAAGTAQELNDQLVAIQKNATLQQGIRRATFYKTGLDLVDEALCPLCDAEWELEELRSHILAKIQGANDAKKLNDDLLENARVLGEAATSLSNLIQKAAVSATTLGRVSDAAALTDWAKTLAVFTFQPPTVDSLLAMQAQLSADWRQTPQGMADTIQAVQKAIEDRPDDSAQVAAREFLTIAQERMEKRRRANTRLLAAKKAHDAAKIALTAYSEAVSKTLGGIYRSIEGNLAAYYRLINHDDESRFTAKLNHTDSKLDLTVDFYSRGLFPPGAYHSEGHQDGMGLCLYLALMQQVLGDQFTFAVLDDVVMSVDNQHRKEVCRLLKTQFPDTQFIITTHDRTWHRQMHSAGLIERDGSVLFRGWTIDAGPHVSECVEIWDEIAGLLESDVSTAAARLRNHLEFVSHDLADALKAQVKYQADNGYDLGDLLPNVTARFKKYLKEAKVAAGSWNDDAKKQSAETLETDFAAKLQATNLEQWAINPAVHYNEWQNFSKEDFAPVVAAFRDLLNSMRCHTCNAWAYITPAKGARETLRCDCSAMNLNLKKR